MFELTLASVGTLVLPSRWGSTVRFVIGDGMSTREIKNAWGKVGDELAGLGLKLKLHAEQEFSDDDLRESDAALQRLSEAVEAAVDTVDNAIGDAAVREDLAETGRRLVDAMSVTMRVASRQIRGVK